jgi:hypothetical protein
MESIARTGIMRPTQQPIASCGRNKSLFASFSSEKEVACSFLKKRTKRVLLSRAWPETVFCPRALRQRARGIESAQAFGAKATQ